MRVRNTRAGRVLAVAELLREFRDTWVWSQDLEIVGGRCGWRTRVSDCRIWFHMDIENRQVKLPNGTVRSEYRYNSRSRMTTGGECEI